jgi:hypothetical protein
MPIGVVLCVHEPNWEEIYLIDVDAFEISSIYHYLEGDSRCYMNVPKTQYGPKTFEDQLLIESHIVRGSE